MSDPEKPRRSGATDSAEWTSPADIKARVLREWESGRLPAALLGGPSPFPLRIPLHGPSSSELGERFPEARAWIRALQEAASRPGFLIEMRELKHPQLGRNEVPRVAVFELPEDALAFSGKRREAARLISSGQRIEAAFPELGDWMLRRPLMVLEHAEEWPELLGILAWFRAHPRSARYLREIDVPGVHGKFIESRRGLLSELLDCVLDASAIDTDAVGAAAFARRYGLKDKPPLVRLRSLDPGIAFRLGAAPPSREASAHAIDVAQLVIPASDFSRLFDQSRGCPFREAFITENEINFLSFPERSGALVIFGGGYGFASLAEAEWLHRLRLRYWGDLDSHGFAILDQFRARFPEAESFLMDRATILEHRRLWTTETAPSRAELTRLSAEESALYEEIRQNRLGEAIRLEQERIGFEWLKSALGPEKT